MNGSPLQFVLRLVGLSALFLASTLPGWSVIVGASKQDVIAELGKPTSTALRENREILSYPKGVRIVLVDGRVQSAEGMALSVEDSDAPAVADAKVEPAPAPAAVVKPAAPAPKAAAAPPPPPDRKARLAPLLKYVFQFVLTIIALKIAFRIWTMNGRASGILAIAAIDLLLHFLCDKFSPATGGLLGRAGIQSAIAGFVMIWTIRAFCFNKNTSDAVQTALVVKVAAGLLNAVLLMAVLSRLG